MKKLKIHKGKIVQADNNKPVYLRGCNLGGWLMMEAYFLHTPNLPVKDLTRQLLPAIGKKGVEDFYKKFRDNFIVEADLKRIASFGLNVVRLPFHHGLIEKTPFKYDKEGLTYLDRAISWAKKYGIYVILDLHGAAGSQNHDWHSDSYGEALLWKDKKNQERTYALWEFLANRYKNETAVAGYDLLNEAVIADHVLLNKFYNNIIKAIRKNDKNHILFIEGNKWAQDLECLEFFEDDNYALSIHFYEPIQFTFNMTPHLTYPLKGQQGNWDKSVTAAMHAKYAKLAATHQAPIFVGEFGVNYRNGFYKEENWVKDTVQVFNSLGFHWTYWTYKAIKNAMFPDGLLSYYPNPPWVRREGPVTGWNTYNKLWATRKKDMVDSWRSENFTENPKVIQVLKKYA